MRYPPSFSKKKYDEYWKKEDQQKVEDWHCSTVDGGRTRETQKVVKLLQSKNVYLFWYPLCFRFESDHFLIWCIMLVLFLLSFTYLFCLLLYPIYMYHVNSYVSKTITFTFWLLIRLYGLLWILKTFFISNILNFYLLNTF